jgi:hypothetical protein
MKTDKIIIEITGNKKFRQLIIDKVYEVLMEDEIQESCAKPGCGMDLEFSMEPSQVVDGA